MSYILEALKKSEQERERGNIPDLQSIHTPVEQEASRSHLWIYIILVSIILAGVITTVWRTFIPLDTFMVQQVPAERVPSDINPSTPAIVARDDEREMPSSNAAVKKTVKSAPEKKSSPAVGSATQAPVTVTGNTSQVPDTRPSETRTSSNVVFLEKEIPADQMYSTSPLESTKPDVKQDSGATIGTDDKPAASNALAETHQSRMKDADIPNLANLPASIRKGMPDITFSGHVYNSVPQRRSVIINDKFMREGEYVTPDIKLVEITDRGAIFRYNDTLFRLSALQDWSSR